MWLLMNDGARNARLNETRNVCAGVRLDHEASCAARRPASSIDENLSTRPPTTQRKWSPRKISSCTKPPPSLRSSPSGRDARCRRCCGGSCRRRSARSACRSARTSPASTSNVLVSKPSGRNWPVGAAREQVRRVAVEQVGEERHAAAALLVARREVGHLRVARDVERADAAVDDALGAGDAAAERSRVPPPAMS